MEIRGRAVHHGARRSSQHLQSLRQGECPELEASLDSIGIRVQPGLHVETLFQNETFKKKKGGGGGHPGESCRLSLLLCLYPGPATHTLLPVFPSMMGNTDPRISLPRIPLHSLPLARKDAFCPVR